MAVNLNDPNRVTYFAETDSRNRRVKFGIKAKDRTRHMYVIGKTGMGKSTMLENMAVQDIQNGEGMCFIDPHGKTADLLLEYVPEHRVKDVIYFAPFDIENPISFNIMEDVGADKRHLVVSGLMSAFKKLFGEESFSDRMQYILQNTILALLEYPNSTMLGINRMLTDKVFRNKVVDNVTDMSVKAYWTQEFAKYTEKFAAEATPAIQNKMGQFISNPLIRNMIGQPKSTFDIRKIMDERKILIVNLSKGRVGEGNANLLGSMLITKIYLAAMSRADQSEAELAKKPNFYLFVDEFQSFANESFADILSEARKYKLNLTVAHQYIEQMEEEVRDAVFGNVGTMITFRVGAFDAEVLEKEFAPQFTAIDLVNLGFTQIYLKLMIDGVSSQPFSASTLGPIAKPAVNMMQQVIESSRLQFTRKRADIETEIAKWYEPIEPPPKAPREGGFGEGKPAGASAPYNPKPAAVGASFGKSIDARPQPPRGASAPYNPRPAAPAAAPASAPAASAVPPVSAAVAVPARVPVAPVAAAPEKKLAFKEAFAAVSLIPPSPAAAKTEASAAVISEAKRPFPSAMPTPSKPAPSKNLSGLREALAAIKKAEPAKPSSHAVVPPAVSMEPLVEKKTEASKPVPAPIAEPVKAEIPAERKPLPAAPSPQPKVANEMSQAELEKLLDVPLPPEIL